MLYPLAVLIYKGESLIKTALVGFYFIYLI